MKKKILVTSSVVAQSLSASVALAQSTTPTVSIPITDTGGDPITKVVELIQKFGGWLLLIAGALAVVFLVIGGIRYLVSAGNSAQTEGAKKTIMYALIGLIVIVISAFAVNLVISLFT